MKKCWIIISLTILALTFSFADDGMWLPHQMKILNLKSAGLEMDPGMLYNQDGTGIMSAVVHLGGGSGEFVSNDGLILTNHHVAFGAIQRGSDADHDYITDGFTAWDHSEEIPAVGYFANVLLGYKDVSDIVLAKVKPGMNEEKREKRIEKIIEKLSEAEEAKAADLRVVIRAMYGGNKYFMFTFKHISDIRLVYAPPKSLGNFGGDVDNWMWPRHTCDFSFLRAYVSPDGEGTDYSEENVPYRPKAKLKISLDGLKEGDFTFVMGYPGRTYRNYMMKEVEAEVSRMEGSISQRIANIDFLEKAGQDNRGVQIKYASRIKSLNNYLKNYQGKLESFEKANILNIKKLWEQELLDWINADNERFNKYGDVVAAFNKAFELQAAFRAEASNYPNF
ncbi:S46 family peptidase, partial [bacterium]|nr:S46 family peptidase [bacterium]